MSEAVKKTQRSLWMDAWRRLRKNRLAMIGLGFILLLVVLALFTVAVDIVTKGTFYDEHVIKQNLRLRLQGPSAEHIFGLDEFGRDIFLRVIWAIRNPKLGVIEPDDIDHDTMIDIARPYLGEIVGSYGQWTPLEGRNWPFEEDIDPSDPFQFKNIRVS